MNNRYEQAFYQRRYMNGTWKDVQYYVIREMQIEIM